MPKHKLYKHIYLGKTCLVVQYITISQTDITVITAISVCEIHIIIHIINNNDNDTQHITKFPNRKL
jgi:hypothetical protein